MTEVGYFRGAGGMVFDFLLPLSENMQNQVTRGELVRVNEDGSTYDPPESDGPEVPAGPPKVSALKNEWVGYAVSQGMSIDDADAMSKGDLIEKFGSK